MNMDLFGPCEIYILDVSRQRNKLQNTGLKYGFNRHSALLPGGFLGQILSLLCR
jgi:hypothetical protein